ncbi:MAG: DUF6443 domain-containing protein [Ekhidna sp.]
MKLTKSLYIFIFLSVIFHISVFAQTVNGNSQVGVSTFQTYTYSGSYSTGYRWAVVGGTISSSSGLTVNIIWSGSPGTGKVQFYPSRFAFTPHELAVTKHANPPTPSTPSVSGNTCGNKTVTRGNPPSGITWYWQTSSGGASTSNSNSTYTKTSSGYLYLRARRNATGQWSGSSSVYVTVNHAPGMPSTPSVSSNTCGNKTVTRGNPPSGITWYWQTSSGGVSTSNSSSTYTVTSSRTVYLKARNNSSGCWSSARSVFVSVNQSPGQPAALSVSSNTCGSKTVTRPGVPGGQTYYWQTSASGTSTSNSSGSYVAHNSQWVYIRAKNDIGGCWSTARSVYVTVNTLPSTPSTPSVSSNTCGNKTITRGNPPSGITWYWQTSSGGVSTSNANSTYTKTSSGNLYLRARNNSTGCWSTNSSSVSVTVNFPPAAPSISGMSMCGSGNAILVVDGYSQNQFAPFKWYTASSGGTAFASGISSINESVSSTTSYYVSRYNETTLCESGRTQVTVTVQQPTHTTGTSESHCQTAVAVPLTGEPAYTGTWSINGPPSAIVFGNAVDMTALNPGQTYQATYTYTNGICGSNTFVKDIYVRPLSVAGTIAGDSLRCGSGTSTFTLSGHTGTVLKWESRYQDGSGSWSVWDLITDTDDVLQVSPNLIEWAGGVRTYEIKAYVQNGECNQVASTKQISIDPQSVGGSVSGGKESFVSATGSLTLLGKTGTVERWEKSTDGGATWSIINHVSETYPYSNVSTTTLFRAVVKSGICSEAVSATEQVTILPAPSINLSGLSNIRDCQSTTLVATQGYANYAWYLNDVLIPNESSHELHIDQPGVYKLTITSSGGATYTISNFNVTSQFILDHNAVTTFTYRVPTTAPDSSFCFSVEDRSVDVQIFDGLGRPIQQISLNASPLAQDIVVPMEYDDLGRQTKNYLPYSDTDLSVIYKTDALVDQPTFYLGNKGSNKAYSETRFETSPLNRPLEQGAPGDSWQIGQHTVKFEYAIADSAEVINWNFLSFDTLLSNPKEVYDLGELYKNTTFDEDSSQTVAYTNKQGQTILKKSQLDTTWAETYYIYDIYGQLVVVLPPEGSKSLKDDFFHVSKTPTDRQAFLDLWAFQYAYDGRGRMTEKKVPGAERMFMVYDQWDRLVLTQDGNQRDNSQWLFTKYDELSRPIITGLMSGGNEATERTAVAASSVRFDTLNTTLVNEYSNQSYPTTGIDEYLTVTYYDNYDWDTTGLSFSNPTGLLLNAIVKGQVTGTLTKVVNDNGSLPGGWIKSASYYDDKYRVIQVQSTNHLGGKDVVTNHFDFIGQVMKSISLHDNGDTTFTITRSFNYDHAGRLLNTWHLLNNYDSVKIVENHYNELSELKDKDLHGGTGGVFAQSLDYAYNIRGWLESINDPALSSTNDTNTDLFGMNLYYDTAVAALASQQLFNGNISAMEWSDFASMGTNTRAYAYTYDDLNRIKNADHFDGGVTSNFDVSAITYEMNGNIKSLVRNGATGADMDNLTYDYEGNQLREVSDVGSDTTGFYDGFTANLDSADYSYDANGNMVKDRNKGIDTIYYNHLNLPTTVILSNSEGSQDSIKYLYDAAGIKLQQIVYDSGVLVKMTDYVGEFIYENDTLELIQHVEGRIIPVRNIAGDAIESYDYQYHLKDHLGNVRLTFSSTPEEYVTVQNMESLNDAMTESESPTNFVNIPFRQDVNANTSIGGDEVATLNAGSAGVMSLIRVKKNDEMSFSVYANYLNDPSTSDLLSLAGGAIFNAYNNGANSSGLEGLTSATNLEIGSAVTAMTSGAGAKSSSGDAPKAYLNYIYFDKYMSFNRAGFAQISNAAKGLSAHELITLDVGTMEAEGYILVYLSNENNAAIQVNFDDLTINHTIVNDVVSTQDYYPFGLTFNATSRTASTPQKFLYNNKELQEGTDWLDYGARMYQPEVGRFFNQDRYAEKYMNFNPYQYTLNNPILYVDVNGDSVNVAEKYRDQMTSALSAVFGLKASDFSYSEAGNLIFNGSTDDLSKEEAAVFGDFSTVLNEKTTTNIVFEKQHSVIDNDGNKIPINTANYGGEATLTTSDANVSENYVIIDPAESVKATVFPLNPNFNPNAPMSPSNPVSTGAVEVNNSRNNRTWHGIGHAIFRGQTQDKVMDFDNATRSANKRFNSLGSVLKPLPLKPYDTNHNINEQ